jgi:hypothetical protein
VELETAVGLARPSASAAATADSGNSTDAATIGTLSSFLGETQAETLIAKVAAALKPAAASTAAMATSALADARQAAVTFAASAAPLLMAPQRMFTMAHIDADATFNDEISSLTDELASIPRAVAVNHSTARAWAITGIVLAADAVMIARYRSKRASAFNDRMKIAV